MKWVLLLGLKRLGQKAEVWRIADTHVFSSATLPALMPSVCHSGESRKTGPTWLTRISGNYQLASLTSFNINLQQQQKNVIDLFFPFCLLLLGLPLDSWWTAANKTWRGWKGQWREAGAFPPNGQQLPSLQEWWHSCRLILRLPKSPRGKLFSSAQRRGGGVRGG